MHDSKYNFHVSCGKYTVELLEYYNWVTYMMLLPANEWLSFKHNLVGNKLINRI